MCENCDEDEAERRKDWLDLRFIGGKHKKYPYRGPWLTYETGKVYHVSPEFKTLLYWEAVDKAEKAEELEAEIEVEVKTEVIDEEAESEVQIPSSGLTKAYGGMPPTEEDFIMSMDIATLRVYIEGQRGKVDKRWGRKRLVEEALKLQ